MKRVRNAKPENLIDEQPVSMALQLVLEEKPRRRLGNGLIELQKLFGRLR